MIGITLDAQQIQNAPAAVRHWLEQQMSGVLGPRPEVGLQAPHLTACTDAQAADLLSRIKQAPSAVEVFFEFARPDISYGEPPVMAFRLIDLQRHSGLDSIAKLLDCLALINRALAEVCNDASARFCEFDNQGHCLILPATQRSIAAVWKAIVAAERPGATALAAE